MPVRPAAGEEIELRATTDRSVGRLELEMTVDGAHSIVPASLVELDDASRAGGARRAWRVDLDGLGAGTRVSYRFISPGRRTRWHGFVVGGWVPEPTGPTLEVDAGHLVPGSVAWLQADEGPWRVRFALALGAGDHVIGFGERYDALDQHGRRLDAQVYEQYKDQGNRTYLPVPFAVVLSAVSSDLGWGFHVRTSRRTWYDVGASDPKRLWVEVELDPAEPAPRVEVRTYEGLPAHVLRAFLDETCRPVAPPDWVYRPWMSGNEWNTEARARAEVQRSLDEGISVGVLVLEAWSDESTFAAFRDSRYVVHDDGAPHALADFTFPPDGAWPDPAGFVQWLHEHGIRVLLWQVPLLKSDPPPGSQARADADTALARGYAVREGDGRPYRNRGWWFPRALLPDWTNPELADWWLAKRRYLVEEVGIDGFKTDGGEHAWGNDLRYADGSRGGETNNRYPVLYAAAYHRLLREAGREPVTFSRAGFTGSAAFACHWAGDEVSSWAAFRASITAGLTAGASGIFFWGWDLAGFSGEVPDAELYLRAAAMACFCPIMQYHSEFNGHRQPSRDRTPWNVAERTGDSQVLMVYRRFAEIRESLVPYLTEQATSAVANRLPLMRALCFDWPDDLDVWKHPYQYLLGDDLLVAPVVEPGGDIEIYLPAGDWVDFWDGTEHAGPRTISRSVPLSEIPVFRRLGENATRPRSY